MNDSIEQTVPDAEGVRGSIWRRMLRALVLPPTVSAFEASYLRRINRIAQVFFCTHLPIFVLLAWVNDTDPLFAAVLTLAVLVPSLFAHRVFGAERTRSLVHGFTAMCLGGVLVHIGQGPVQIEMHFYFFSVLAMLAMFANPMVIIVAAVTVSLHHLALWFVVPDSVFNYDAPLWVVLVHALFVVLETVAACFIARTFFDNVIGLEKKVEERTVEIRRRNRDMRLVLDSVREGLVMVDAAGRLSGEHSRALEQWFGSYEPGQTFASYLAQSCPDFGAWFELSWEAIGDGFLPLQLAVDQLPDGVVADGRHYRIDYEPTVDGDGQLQQMLIVISDITADVASAEAEARQRESLTVFERLLEDRPGFIDFYGETARLIERAEQACRHELAVTKRCLHTVKGNASLFGVESVARLCHEAEDRLAEGESHAFEAAMLALRERWEEFSATVDRLLGKQGEDSLVLTNEQYADLLQVVVAGESHEEIVRCLVDLRLEPTEVRLTRFAEQAQALASRLCKGELDVEVGGNGVRLERERFAGFWSSLTHVLRNAVDHGIEEPEQRQACGKASGGRLVLETYETDDQIVLEVRDDGRGIDWGAVRCKAAELGIECESDSPYDALFANGLSTCQDVTELSGRGVGLAAVREACDQVGGSIEVETEVGRGSTFRFRFPAASKADYPECAAPARA